ncbi:MAG: M67 family metallopeptidase [Clostridiales Family XIII bacterium]|jgi:proteasome lid subunit RPN8/RPN11|nr:M67 family metallopeptidase [Clostridiales Family XIII bacterium]
MLTLAEGAGRAIKQEGRAKYPHECCGAALGRFEGGGRTAEVAFSIENSHPEDGRRRRFAITSEDYLRADAEARRLGLEVVGFYHSHPDHPARPSEFDLRQALPGYAYLILAVAEGEPGELTAWGLADDRSEFIEEGITWR